MDTTKKKISYTPGQYAICATVIVVMVCLLSGTALIMTIAPNTGSHIGILLGGIAGVILYLIQKRRIDLREQIKTFDVTVVLMMFLLNWTACGLVSSVYGMIASKFSAIEPVVSTPGTLAAILGSVIAAPIGEELMFRLCSMGLMKNNFSKLFTILFPTLIFTFMHAFYGLQGLFEIFAGSIFFAICYYYTENILYTVIVHMIHNLLCIPSFIRTFERYDNGYTVLKTPVFILYAVIFAAAMVWLIKVFVKKYSPAEKQG